MQAQGSVPPVTRCRSRQQWSAEQRRAPRCCMVTAGCGGRVVECRHRRVARLAPLSCPCDGLSMPLPLRHTRHSALLLRCSQRPAAAQCRTGRGCWVGASVVRLRPLRSSRLRQALKKTKHILICALSRPLCGYAGPCAVRCSGKPSSVPSISVRFYHPSPVTHQLGGDRLSPRSFLFYLE